MAKGANGKNFGTIHDNVQLLDVDKFCYLQGLIARPAKATIAGFSLTADNYNMVVKL